MASVTRRTASTTTGPIVRLAEAVHTSTWTTGLAATAARTFLAEPRKIG